MERAREAEAVSGLTDVFSVSFIDLALVTACVVKMSDAATITTPYTFRAFAKVFFIIDLPSDLFFSSSVFLFF
jgi:hypothetical protein